MLGLCCTLTKALDKILNGNYTRMLSTILNRSWKDHPNNKEIYGNIPDICTSIRQQRLRFSGHCWRSKLELTSDVIIWQPTHGNRKKVDPAGPTSISWWMIYSVMLMK